MEERSNCTKLNVAHDQDERQGENAHDLSTIVGFSKSSRFIGSIVYHYVHVNAETQLLTKTFGEFILYRPCTRANKFDLVLKMNRGQGTHEYRYSTS